MTTTVTDVSGAGSADGDSGPEPEPTAGSISGGDAPADWISIHADLPDPVGLSQLEDWLRRVIDELPCPLRRASFELIDDRRMTALHRRHLGIDGTTDVLTFPAGDRARPEGRPGGGGATVREARSGEPIDVPIDADIAICVDEARRQAQARGHALDREILLYAIHGLLHCAGFDDHGAEDAAAMHAEEDRILEAIGVGTVFARPLRSEERR